MSMPKLGQKREQHANNRHKRLCNSMLICVFALRTTAITALAVAVHRYFGVSIACMLRVPSTLLHCVHRDVQKRAATK